LNISLRAWSLYVCIGVAAAAPQRERASVCAATGRDVWPSLVRICKSARAVHAVKTHCDSSRVRRATLEERSRVGILAHIPLGDLANEEVQCVQRVL